MLIDYTFLPLINTVSDCNYKLKCERNVNIRNWTFLKYQLNAHFLYSITIHRVIQEESAIIWEMIVCVILSKKKFI